MLRNDMGVANPHNENLTGCHGLWTLEPGLHAYKVHILCLGLFTTNCMQWSVWPPRVTKIRLSRMTKWEVRPVTMPRCTNKWSTHNKRWWDHGKRTTNLIPKSTEYTTTFSFRSDSFEEGSHSVLASHPDQGRQNVGITSASSNFSIVDSQGISCILVQSITGCYSFLQIEVY